MAKDCDARIDLGPGFPRRPWNRPALGRIAYRIGEYPDMVRAMRRHIDGEVALSAWTHRGADDPGIALLEGAGILGDILTFYQERYANEAYLRTAAWRESVAALTRLLGYRLAPALGGKARLAVEAKGAGSVTVPAGFPFKADLEDLDAPAEFQTDAELVAWPHLSSFHLYRPRNYASAVPNGADTVEIDQVGGSEKLADIAALKLKPGEKVLLRPDLPGWTTSSTAAFTNQDSFQILTVKAVEEALGRTKVTFETEIDRNWPLPLRAYRIGRTFRHFGFASPATFTETVKDGDGNITGSKERTTQFVRHLRPTHKCVHTSMIGSYGGRELPLDQEVSDLMERSQVAVFCAVLRDGATKDLLRVRTISKLRATTRGFAAQTAPATILTLNGGLVSYNDGGSHEADIRDYRIYEITSPQIHFRPLATHSGGAFSSGEEALAFFGTRQEVQKIAGRVLSLAHEDGTPAELTCINEVEDFSGSGDDPRMWTLSFGAPPPFPRGDFDETAPKVTVYGNTVLASQGKAVAEAPIGSGDGRQKFQTFPLPKPVTHHLSPGADPAERAELTVYVEGRAWMQVPSFFGQPADAAVYVLREDEAGAFYVQFGDGITGARLPTGKMNVSAAFRTGHGARGALPEGASPNPGTKIDRVGKLFMPGGAAGGSEPESAENAREAAPGKVQGLGRIVSLRDYETECLTIPGVARVAAAREVREGAVGVLLRVLLESGREDEYDEVAAAIRGYQRCRGTNRFPLWVEQARFRQVRLDLQYAHDPALRAEDVEAAVRDLLAPMDRESADPKGVFAFRARRIGGPEYATRIEGRVKGLDGLTWARVTALGLLSAAYGTPPEDIALPPAPRGYAAQVTPGADELLQLHSVHLTLTVAPPDPGEDCA